jgi:hypothetical protein
VRCTTGAGAGAVLVVVLEREKQPEPSVVAARTNPRAKHFIMQVPSAKALLRMHPTVSCSDDREKCFGAATPHTGLRLLRNWVGAAAVTQNIPSIRISAAFLALNDTFTEPNDAGGSKGLDALNSMCGCC